MAGRTGPEDSIKNLKIIYAADMPAALDAVDAYYADDIELEDIDEYLEAHLPSTDIFPYIVFFCTESVASVGERQNRIYVHTMGATIGLVARFEGLEGLHPQEELIRRINRTEEAFRAVMESETGKFLVVGGVRNASRVYYHGAQRPILLDVTVADEEYEVSLQVDFEVRIALDV